MWRLRSCSCRRRFSWPVSPLFAIGVALGDIALALRLAAWTGLAAAAAFFVGDILMDLAGWRVGAPGAAERATMLTVMMVGNLAAAVAGGAMLAIGLLSAKTLG